MMLSCPAIDYPLISRTSFSKRRIYRPCNSRRLNWVWCSSGEQSWEKLDCLVFSSGAEGQRNQESGVSAVNDMQRWKSSNESNWTVKMMLPNWKPWGPPLQQMSKKNTLHTKLPKLVPSQRHAYVSQKKFNSSTKLKNPFVFHARALFPSSKT